MSINLNDADLKAVIAKAIIDQLTPERREALISEAIKQLLNASGDRYDHRSKLQQAFDVAVQEVARKTAQDLLTGNTVMTERIRTLMVSAFERVVSGEAGEKLVDKMANAMRQALTGERW